MSAPLGCGRVHRHAAKFYDTEPSLFCTVSGFLAEGLLSSEPALVIATPSHVAGIESALADRGVDVAAARRAGELIVLDAEDTLGTFFVGTGPDAGLFDQQMGDVIDQILRGRRPAVIRAYGEMVDVLWQQGMSMAALHLEMLWNKLALKYAFSLLCGYSMGHFYKEAGQFHDVCGHHTHVLDPACTDVRFDAIQTRYA